MGRAKVTHAFALEYPINYLLSRRRPHLFISQKTHPSIYTPELGGFSRPIKNNSENNLKFYHLFSNDCIGCNDYT